MAFAWDRSVLQETPSSSAFAIRLMELEVKKPVAIPRRSTEIRICAIADCAVPKAQIPLEVDAGVSAPSLITSTAQEGLMEK